MADFGISCLLKKKRTNEKANTIMKKEEKIALIIMFIVGLILMVAIEYSNKTTAEKIQYEREKIEARLEAVKVKDSIENKKD